MWGVMVVMWPYQPPKYMMSQPILTVFEGGGTGHASLRNT